MDVQARVFPALILDLGTCFSLLGSYTSKWTVGVCHEMKHHHGIQEEKDNDRHVPPIRPDLEVATAVNHGK